MANSQYHGRISIQLSGQKSEQCDFMDQNGRALQDRARSAGGA